MPLSIAEIKRYIKHSQEEFAKIDILIKDLEESHIVQHQSLGKRFWVDILCQLPDDRSCAAQVEFFENDLEKMSTKDFFELLTEGANRVFSYRAKISEDNPDHTSESPSTDHAEDQTSQQPQQNSPSEPYP